MFERRLWFFICGLGLLAVLIGARLVDIQVIRAGQYHELVPRITPRESRFVRPARGAILDRKGRTLVSDEPASDLTMYYAVIERNPNYLRTLARRMRRSGEIPAEVELDEAIEMLRDSLLQTRQIVADAAGVSISMLSEREEAIVKRVQAVKEFIREKSPTVSTIREESRWHAVLEDIPPKLAAELQLRLGNQPWVRVQPGARRVRREADELTHILGRIGAVDDKRIAADPLAGDDLRELRPGDFCGISGVERVADTILRGVRGRVVQDFAQGTEERVEPEPGRDVMLTIDADLQKQIYELLAEGVKNSLHPAGAAAVVIDVESRDVIAAVTYPTYSSAEFRDNYDDLLRDRIRNPLRNRALQTSYPPGSTCKAIAAVEALDAGVVSPETRIHCTGALLPNRPNMFRCWIFNQSRVTHDDTDTAAGQRTEDAIRNSCNIYFYRVGQMLGPERLCAGFDRFGLGRRAGTGLIEETLGVVPTDAWLQRFMRRHAEKADVWNWAIGQGEVTATPLQVANVAATIASGVWRPVVLVRDADGTPIVGDDHPADVPISARALQPVRVGMWRVVNEQGGTAPGARLSDEVERYVMCGKTGSAQAQPLILNYRFVVEHADGRREEVVEISRDELLKRFPEPKPRIVGQFANDRYPPLGEGGKLPAHAWFMGYTQTRDTPKGATPRGRVYAISVLIEFGAAGGRVAGPIAKSIAELLLAPSGAKG